MISCGIPELEQEEDILYLENKLMLGLTNAEAKKNLKGDYHVNEHKDYTFE